MYMYSSDGSEPTHKAGDLSSVPGLGRSLGEGNGFFQYSCLENPMDRKAWWAAVLRLQRVGQKVSFHLGTNI